MTGAPPRTDELVGTWHRGLLRRPGVVDDRASTVTWLQGPVHYVDLRLPDGFAGRFELAGDLATWHRDLDLSPPAVHPDAGRLTLHRRAVGELPGTTDLLVEDGVHAPYVEHWWREATVDGEPPVGQRAASAAGAEPASGRRVVVVRVGSWFGLARDGEVSLGRIGDHGWQITRSSLSARVGTPLAAARLTPLQLDGIPFDVVHGDDALLRPPR